MIRSGSAVQPTRAPLKGEHTEDVLENIVLARGQLFAS
jgi:hypothetical protein